MSAAGRVGAAPPPEGFEPLRTSPFAALLGDVHVRADPERPVFGIAVLPEHANTDGVGHGGFLSALVDVATTRGARIVLGGNGLRTVSSTVDFLAPAAVGSWLEATVTLDRAGRRTVFASCRITAAGVPVARASVVLARAADDRP